MSRLMYAFRANAYPHLADNWRDVSIFFLGGERREGFTLPPLRASISAVDHFLHRRRIAFTLDHDRGERLLDAVEVVGGQCHVGAAEVLLQSVQLGGPRNRNDPRLLREKPGQRDLRRSHALSGRQLSDEIGQRLIGLQRLRCEARGDPAPVSVLEGGVRTDGASQEASAERTERHEADAQLLYQRQDFGFRLPPPKRIFAL